MNNEFPRIITLLRKERKLSQKQAAQDLDISQALLSHYEKGVRGCSLEFVVKVADYYNVSCDYLLGRAPQRDGAVISVKDLPDDSFYEDKPITVSALLPTLNKKLLINSLNILYTALEQIGSKGLTNEVSAYLTLSVYKMFREIYEANDDNPSDFFAVSQNTYKYISSAVQSIAEGNVSNLANGRNTGSYDGVERDRMPILSPEEISKDFSRFASSLFNLIQNAENRMTSEIQ